MFICHQQECWKVWIAFLKIDWLIFVNPQQSIPNKIYPSSTGPVMESQTSIGFTGFLSPSETQNCLVSQVLSLSVLECLNYQKNNQSIENLFSIHSSEIKKKSICLFLGLQRTDIILIWVGNEPVEALMLPSLWPGRWWFCSLKHARFSATFNSLLSKRDFALPPLMSFWENLKTFNRKQL